MLCQGDHVSCKIDEKIVTGKICGKSVTDQPFIGGIYIIEPDETITNETYPYTHFTMPEVLLTRIPWC
jgi:hypothetical protein